MELAACGNICTLCPRYTATQTGEPHELIEVALLWKQIGYRDEVVSAEEIACHGCISSNWCRYGIRQCAIAKQVRNCGECEDYPCDNILEAISKTLSFAKNIRDRCTEQDFERLHKAFFLKRENLEKVYALRSDGVQRNSPTVQPDRASAGSQLKSIK